MHEIFCEARDVDHCCVGHQDRRQDEDRHQGHQQTGQKPGINHVYSEHAGPLSSDIADAGGDVTRARVTLPWTGPARAAIALP